IPKTIPRTPSSTFSMIAGMSRSTSQNTHQAHTCIKLPPEVKLSAKALLQLACWCRQRIADSNSSTSKHEQGGSIWQHLFPPALRDHSGGCSDDCAVGTIVDTTSANPEAGTARATDTDSRSAAGTSKQQGG